MSVQAVIQSLRSDFQQIHISRAREMPRGYRPICRTGRGDVETDSASERPLDDPPPSPKNLCRAWCDAWPATARCDARATRAEWLPRRNPGRRAHADRPAPVSAAFDLQQQNRVDQGEGFLRVVPIGAGHADRKRNALSIIDQMPFAPALCAIGGIRPRFRAPTHRPHQATVTESPCVARKGCR